MRPKFKVGEFVSCVANDNETYYGKVVGRFRNNETYDEYIYVIQHNTRFNFAPNSCPYGSNTLNGWDRFVWSEHFIRKVKLT